MAVSFRIILLMLLIVCAIAVNLTKDLLQSVIIYMSYSSIMCLLWLLMESPDLAITEAAVGTGISGTLFLLTLKKIREDEEETGKMKYTAASAETAGGKETAGRKPSAGAGEAEEGAAAGAGAAGAGAAGADEGAGVGAAGADEGAAADERAALAGTAAAREQEDR